MITVITTYAKSDLWSCKAFKVGPKLDTLANSYRREVTDNFLSGIRCVFIKQTVRGCAIINFKMADSIACGSLVLGGINSRADFKYCAKFQMKDLTVPPLEFSQRPLIYHRIFRLGGKRDFDQNIESFTETINAFSLAFLRKCCPYKFQKDC